MDADKKILRRRQRRALAVLLAVCAAAVGLFLVLNGGAEDQASAPVSGPAVSSPASEPDVSRPHATESPRGRARGKPDTVLLPRGGEAKLVRKELAEDGSLPIPSSLDEAAWWGAGIGSHGATVLSGHINWNGVTGPFQELWRSRRVDVVTVVDGHGRKSDYRVSEVMTLDKDELPKRAGELFAQSGPNRLVLVTCGGRWIGGSHGYEDNRIVVAVPA